MTPTTETPAERSTAGYDSPSGAALRRSGATGAQRVAEAARILGLLATLAAVGGFAFMFLVVRDEPLERTRVRMWVNASGLALVVSVVVAALTQAVAIESSWSAFWSVDAIADVLSTPFGIAVGLRLAGGLAVFAASRPQVDGQNLTPLTLIVFIGAAAVVASYSFDGHTVTEGPRWLHATANVIHVCAAAVWSGGLAMLADLLWRRHRSGADVIRPLIRFSQMTAATLVLAGAAGTTMAVLVMDRFADLWSTSWGRLLLAKIALVAVAALLGGRNRWVLIPAARRQSQAETHQRLRRSVVLEAVALGCVGVLTAFLVGASTV